MGRHSTVTDCVGPTYSPHQAKEKGSPAGDTKEDCETPTAPREAYPGMDPRGGRTVGRRTIQQIATEAGGKRETGGERNRKISEEDHPRTRTGRGGADGAQVDKNHSVKARTQTSGLCTKDSSRNQHRGGGQGRGLGQTIGKTRTNAGSGATGGRAGSTSWRHSATGEGTDSNNREGRGT